MVPPSLLASLLTHHQSSSGLTLSFIARIAYSHIGGLCLPGILHLGRVDILVNGLFSGVLPTALDILLLTLTVVKVLKMNALSESHPSFSIVRVVLDFDLWLKLINLVRSPKMRALLSHEILYVNQWEICA